jgi:hypothetical protein
MESRGQLPSALLTLLLLRNMKQAHGVKLCQAVWKFKRWQAPSRASPKTWSWPCWSSCSEKLLISWTFSLLIPTMVHIAQRQAIKRKKCVYLLEPNPVSPRWLFCGTISLFSMFQFLVKASQRARFTQPSGLRTWLHQPDQLQGPEPGYLKAQFKVTVKDRNKYKKTLAPGPSIP